ncbi:hypothetical protein Btru_042442 [Bulinus truncatus]|nr:hypothetical protein Btru_042442 [Bulinus truncatus]
MTIQRWLFILGLTLNISAINGSIWSEWTEWMCETCKSSLERKRMCLDIEKGVPDPGCAGETHQNTNVSSISCSEMCISNVENTTDSKTKATPQRTIFGEIRLVPCSAFHGQSGRAADVKTGGNIATVNTTITSNTTTKSTTRGTNGKKEAECKLGAWGLNCSGTCINCAQDCNKVTGSCKKCKEGFKNPHLSCNTPCGYYTYGPNCLGNCLKKCQNQDCIERTAGVCPADAKAKLVLWLLLPGTLLPVSLLLLLRYKQKRVKKSTAEVEVTRIKLSGSVSRKPQSSQADRRKSSNGSLTSATGTKATDPERDVKHLGSSVDYIIMR